jgi:heptosyltransferase-1
MKILIVKLSSLGDVVHAMPAVQDISQAYPEAEIDWVVERGFAPLVRRCDGVHQVIECELRRWRKTPLAPATRAAWSAFRYELQAQSYDAVIDLQGLSKSALVAWLACLAPGGLRYGLANQTEGSSFEAPARWVAHVAVALPAHIHAVARSRELCARALGYVPSTLMSFGLLAHINQTQGAINSGAVIPTVPRGQVALVHGTSRADKQWPVAQWQALGRRLNDAGYGVVVPHGSEAEEATAREIAASVPHATVWPRLGLDALTDALGACAGVIGVDSGLSHIAVALDLPHVQIYNFDTAWRTGPMDATGSSSDAVTAIHPRQCSVFAHPSPALDSVWQAWLDVSADSQSV